MRLAKLELLAYGPFRGLVLDFSAPGLHVVFGRNEAGKSTTLRAITGLLYGIDRNTPDAHVHKMTDLRIGGVLEGRNGDRVRVVRRKGNANTLLDAQGDPLDEAVVKRLLGAVTQETFRNAFGLDHDTLAAGARALLEGKGDLGESLFDASVGGGGDVQRLLAELEAEADKIYKPRATSLPLNEALKSFADAQKTVRERQSLPEAFLAQESALTEAGRDRAERIATTKALKARRERIERGRRRVPLERKRDRALERRAALGAVVGQAERALALRDRFFAYERCLEQRREHVAEAERLGERVVEAARRAGTSDATGAPAAPSLDARKEARVHKLLTDRTALGKQLEVAKNEIARLERELARMSTPEAPADGAEPDTGSIALALDRARALGDIEARIASMRSQNERQKRKLEERALAMGLFEGTLDAFVGLRLPPPVTVERLESRATTLDRTLARLDERAADLEKEAASLAKQTATQTGDFAPPDAAVLQTARALRDEAWKALRDSPSAAARHGAEIEVERLLREADVVADRMIREADRVTTLARLRSESEANAAQLAKLREDRERAMQERVALDVELASLFADAAIRPLGFAEMRQWLARHAQIADARSALREAEESVHDEESKVDRAKRDLVAAIPNIDATSSLADRISFGTRRLAAIEAARRAREDAARAIAKIRDELDERLVARDRDEALLTEVTAKLAELVVPLGIPADASASEVNRSIEALRELLGLVERRGDMESRARVADADARSFEAELTRALVELAPDLASREARDAAATLFQRGQEAKDVAHELATLDAQLEHEGDVALDDADLAIVADSEAASRAVQDLTEQIDDLETETTRLGERIGGLRKGLDEMRAESQAAEAASSAQHHLARVRENAERWARLKLAAVLLSREIERYRDENQGPLLTSSSSLFSRLTLGAFSGIKAAFDEKDRPCLRCVRGDGKTEVDIVGLSDGTRDQLYLSLRLASLLRHSSVAEPTPLVLDDVLIQLDDQRASAALSVLAEVSQEMQILFFTHHARLVELARAAVSSDRLVVHELVSDPAQSAIASAST
jgi:uncharacterized protein YhaN